MNSCLYFPQCGGCNFWDQSYVIQKQYKIQVLSALLPSFEAEKIEFLSCGEEGLRHRADFTLEYDAAKKRHKFGFYSPNSRDLLDIDICRQFCPDLQSIFEEFKRFKFYYGDHPIQKASVRLRVSPNGKKGCWLDFANTDIKNCLEDQILFRKLLTAGFQVEIGQKGKSLTSHNEELKLGPPKPEVWFETCSLPLQGLISDFTQPSWISGNLLVQTVLGWISDLAGVRSVLEFGPGLGPFTLGFLRAGYHVEACEVHVPSAEHLKLNAQVLGLAKNLKINTGDYHRQQLSHGTRHDLVFVNPARSGLKSFTQQLVKTGAEYLIYVSCFPESMTEDLKNLSDKYRLLEVKIVDQFPQSKHFESLALLKKVTSASRS